MIENDLAWEVGVGVYSATDGTLTRPAGNLVASSSSFLLNLSGTATVYVTPNSGCLPPKLEEFTTSGTWTKHPLAKTVEVICIGGGGGGGGGGGYTSSPGEDVGGGGGGGGGGYSHQTFDASTLRSTADVTIGGGGSGGAAGANGSDGAFTSFGAYLGAWGGFGGLPGTASQGGSGGQGGPGNFAGYGGGGGGGGGADGGPYRAAADPAPKDVGDQEIIQSMHDQAVKLGVRCGATNSGAAPADIRAMPAGPAKTRAILEATARR